MGDYEWYPIEPLTDHDRQIDLGDIRSLYDSWHAVRERLRKESPESLHRFTERLIRSLSIETGIIERVYDLDRGTTEALVMHGFVEELVARSSTNIEPSLLIDILRDQEAAVRLVMDCVASNRDLTKGFIHELQATLTRHQHTTKAVDQFGNRIEIPLRKGAYKEFPNNPTRPDGSVHHYCPPIQVDSEMDNLLTWFKEYDDQDPILVMSWLHHRFTQIHPYQDGNGRVARALATLVLLKADLLPLVVDRDLRLDYIGSLESADRGDLSKLVSFFSTLEKRAILQALSVDVDADISQERSVTSAVIESLAAKFRRRREAKDEELRKVNQVAIELRARSKGLIEESLHALSNTVSQITTADVFVLEGGPEFHNDYWYRREVIDSGKYSDKWVNFDESHFFVKSTIRAGSVRLVFVVSFHHIGRELSGIMEVTAFAFLEFYEERNDRIATSEKYFPCSLDPFVITWNTDLEKILPSYTKWLDASLAVGVKEWGDQL